MARVVFSTCCNQYNEVFSPGLYLGVLRPTLQGYVPPGLAALRVGYAQVCHQLADATGMEFYV
jgi:hypothetical protein